MQNIPSHNKEIRMLFKAETKFRSEELSSDNTYKVLDIDELLTDKGWKSAKDISINDILITEDQKKQQVVDILIQDSAYIFTVEGGDETNEK